MYKPNYTSYLVHKYINSSPTAYHTKMDSLQSEFTMFLYNYIYTLKVIQKICMQSKEHLTCLCDCFFSLKIVKTFITVKIIFLKSFDI